MILPLVKSPSNSNLVAYINDETTQTYLVRQLITEHSDKPHIKALGEKLLLQHRELHELLNTTNLTVADLRELGQALYNPIRFEEREVFPVAQALLSKEQLNAIKNIQGKALNDQIG